MRGQQHSIGGQQVQAGQMADAVEANDALVHWTVRRQWLGRLGYQEAVQEGRIALWRALARYEAGRGRLSSYAVVAIERAVWRAVERAGKAGDAHRGSEIACGALEMAGEIDRVIQRAQVHALVAELPARLQEVIRRRYGLDGTGEATFREIGQALGVTKQRAVQLHAEALLHLADPATSTTLRRQMGRNGVRDYQAYLARRRAWQRRGRSGR